MSKEDGNFWGIREKENKLKLTKVKGKNLTLFANLLQYLKVCLYLKKM